MLHVVMIFKEKQKNMRSDPLIIFLSPLMEKQRL